MKLWQNVNVEFYHTAMKHYSSLLLFLFLLLSAARCQAELPDSFTASYALYYDDLKIGVMERRFINQGKTGTFESNGKLTGLAALFRKDRIAESSRWEVHEGQLRPLEYRFVRTGGKREKKEYHHFDWYQKKIVSRTQDGEKILQAKPGVLDKLLYQLAMMELKDPENGLKFDLVDGTTLKTYTFKFVGREKIKTPMGKLETLKFVRVWPESVEHKRSSTLWTAPSLHHLPVRVDNTDNKGHLTKIVIKDLEGL